MPSTEICLGISVEEMERMRHPQDVWQTTVYPLIGYKATKKEIFKIDNPLRFRRSDCTSWLRERNYPIPPKSSCIICPYQANAEWLDMKQNRPNEWKRAVRLDYSIRNSTHAGIKNPVYLHKSCIPLDKVDLGESQVSLDFRSECSGHCGI
jgi:hypothetical protein